MINKDDILKYCNCDDCKKKVESLFNELGKMESNLIVYELEVSRLLNDCPTCEFKGTNKLL